ncbi:hypothetical protein [Bacillus sp. EB600]|uniref:hypothetical protein n=1 Tax=Bacillus sp. EB600 TaxID=2806345 RepID=UPI00210CB4D3|nr:hypothetical protein [Bacillus sp. EB600]MCQ6282079.1 hypothetical protein [Bacillus sp. EB600]
MNQKNKKRLLNQKLKKQKNQNPFPINIIRFHGVRDKEWVYADDWVQHESFASFEEANQVLDTCKKGHDTQTDANKTAVEQCVKSYILKQNKKG